MREPVRRRFVTDLPGFRRLLIRQGWVSSHREISGNKNSYIGSGFDFISIEEILLFRSSLVGFRAGHPTSIFVGPHKSADALGEKETARSQPRC